MTRVNRKKVSSRLLVAAASLLLAAHKSKKSVHRSCWVKQWISRRHVAGSHATLFHELSVEDPGEFASMLRMDPETYQQLLCLIGPHISHLNTRMRDCISANERLDITLRYLATGASFGELSRIYRVGRTTVGNIIHEVCHEMYKVLQPKYMQMPSSNEDWMKISDQFTQRWNFDHCIGALDGKHIRIDAPMSSGSYFMNYKGYFSIVLMALVDADYKFIHVNVGAAGRESDGGVYQNTRLCHAVENKEIHIPDPVPLPGTNVPMPYVIVADDAFPLKTYLMKPYSSRNLGLEQSIFNYRLSRARRIVENAFGILASRFRVFRHAFQVQPDKVVSIVLAACALHNFLRSKSSSCDAYTPQGCFDYEDHKQLSIVSGSWRSDEAGNGLDGLQSNRCNRSARDALDVRNNFCAYFNSVGAVPWQNQMILKH